MKTIELFWHALNAHPARWTTGILFLASWLWILTQKAATDETCTEPMDEMLTNFNKTEKQIDLEKVN